MVLLVEGLEELESESRSRHFNFFAVKLYIVVGTSKTRDSMA